MKKLIIFLGIIILNFNANSQTNFAPIGAEWHFSINRVEGYNRYRVEHDTNFQNRNCRYISCYNENQVKVNEELVLDSAGVIFYWHSGEFRKAMDFTVQEGDTTFFDLKGWTNNGDSDTIVRLNAEITNVETEVIDNESVNVFTAEIIDNPNYLDLSHFSYKSKIGTVVLGSGELFPHLGAISSVPEPYNFLRCYNDNSINYVSSTWKGWPGLSRSCDYYEPVSVDHVSENEKVTVYPNPVKNYLTVKSQSSLIQSISVYDAQGRLVLEKGVNASNAEISTDTFENGLYFFNLKTSSGTMMKKVVKN